VTYSIEPSDLVLGFGPERVFPFIEHNGNLTGYGHQDRQAFADAANTYDRTQSPSGFSNGWQADDVEHAWAARDAIDLLIADDEFHLCPEGTPGAVPVTLLWGKR
jgi:hypothetical protein